MFWSDCLPFNSGPTNPGMDGAGYIRFEEESKNLQILSHVSPSGYFPRLACHLLHYGVMLYQRIALPVDAVVQRMACITIFLRHTISIHNFDDLECRSVLCSVGGASEVPRSQHETFLFFLYFYTFAIFQITTWFDKPLYMHNSTGN